MSGSVAGAEMITFLAPAARCLAASSRLVKRPVDSITTSQPRSPQGRSAGSRSERTLISLPSTVIEPSPASTVAREAAEDRVVLEQVGERLGVGQVVDGDEVEVGPGLVRCPEEVAPDPAEAVDADLRCHVASWLVDELSAAGCGDANPRGTAPQPDRAASSGRTAARAAARRSPRAATIARCPHSKPAPVVSGS